MNNLKIRSAEVKDARDILDVFYQTWIQTYPNKDLGITVEDIEELLKNSFNAVFFFCPSFSKYINESIYNLYFI